MMTTAETTGSDNTGPVELTPRQRRRLVAIALSSFGLVPGDGVISCPCGGAFLKWGDALDNSPTTSIVCELCGNEITVTVAPSTDAASA